jgi:TPR repeat protein
VFRLGEGTPIDLQRALTEFQRGCDLEAAIGCTEAGILYWQSEVVAPDLAKAAALFERGCGLGSQVACKNGDALRDAQKP